MRRAARPRSIQSPSGSSSAAAGSRALGSAALKYQCQGEVPHSDDRFSTVLKRNTSSSGQSARRQTTESIATVSASALPPSPALSAARAVAGEGQGRTSDPR